MDDTAERLARRIARAGRASRRDAEALIEAGRVRVNGQVATTPATTVTARDRVEVDGTPLPAPEPARLWLYHKPAGLVTTARDEKGRVTVFDRLPEGMPRVMSVGRLDLSSEGLLLLTNDGALKRRLELPSTGWLRRYRVRVHGTPEEAALDRLRAGIELDGEAFQPMQVTLDRQQGANAWATVGLREGRNREVRRAFEAIGLRVNRLIRVSYGPFQLGALGAGEVSEVKPRILREQMGWDMADHEDDARKDGPKGAAARKDGPRKDGPRKDGPRKDGPHKDGPRKPRAGAKGRGGPPKPRPSGDRLAPGAASGEGFGGKGRHGAKDRPGGQPKDRPGEARPRREATTRDAGRGPVRTAKAPLTRNDRTEADRPGRAGPGRGGSERGGAGRGGPGRGAPGGDAAGRGSPGRDKPRRGGPDGGGPRRPGPGRGPSGEGEPGKGGPRRVGPRTGGPRTGGPMTGGPSRDGAGAPAKPARPTKSQRRAAMRADSAVSLRKGGQRGRGIDRPKKAPGKPFRRPGGPGGAGGPGGSGGGPGGEPAD
jgi:23S rRNA pseudouridine2605 synthase